MRTQELNYYLPPELIAQQPAAKRSQSQLLILERQGGQFTDGTFGKIADYLKAGDCLVLNDTKVLAARFFARRKTGGELEALFIQEDSPCIWQVMLKGSRKVKPKETIRLMDKKMNDFCAAEVMEKAQQGRCRLKINTDANLETVLEKIGFAPLPPYIKRNKDLAQNKIDARRYQTVYAQKTGAIAAPTAGLHFTDQLLEQLKAAGVQLAYLTLHVGTGTFKPITEENLQQHQMHQERFIIDKQNAQIINRTKEKGGRVIAVGTTSVRALETAAAGSKVKAVNTATKLFITPGYEFRIIDGMITNFHLPKSTLLALVAAFAGLEKILAAYRHAAEQRYRFYSYGDAMLII